MQGAGPAAASGAGEPARGSRRGRVVARSVVALVVLLHLALIAYHYPRAVVFGDLPYGTPDYQTHFHQISSLVTAYRELGRLWIYDPDLLAGFPTGLVFDVDNKAYFWFVYALTRAGVPLPAAFNCFPVVVAALAPLSLWLAARAMAAPAAAQITAYALGVLAWQLDPTAKFCWYGGMISFAACSALSVSIVACFARMLHELSGLSDLAGDRRRAARPWFVCSLVALPLALLLHAWAFAILAVPMVYLYLRRARALDRAGHLRVWALVAAALAVNLYWLIPALAHAGLMTPSARVGQATPLYLLSDYVERVIDEVNTGPLEQHTFARSVLIFAAIAGARAWRRAGERWRHEVAVVGVAWLGGLTYAGALIPGLRATEPYRFAIPLTFWSGVVAAPWLSRQLSPAALGAAGREARVVLLAVATLLCARGVHELLYFIPELERAQRGAAPGDRPRGGSRRAQPVAPAFVELAASLRAEVERRQDADAGAPGRVLVQWWPLAEYLSWATALPIVGGFPDRRLIFESANLYHMGYDDPRRAGDAFAEYLARYNVHYVVTSEPADSLMAARVDLLEPGPAVAGYFQIFRVRAPSDYFARGRGRVRTGPGLIELTDVEPDSESGELVLKFHYMRELACRPGCRLEPAPVPGADAAFIRVVASGEVPRAVLITHGR